MNRLEPRKTGKYQAINRPEQAITGKLKPAQSEENFLLAWWLVQHGWKSAACEDDVPSLSAG
jgi:hypothetical protein